MWQFDKRTYTAKEVETKVGGGWRVWCVCGRGGGQEGHSCLLVLRVGLPSARPAHHRAELQLPCMRGVPAMCPSRQGRRWYLEGGQGQDYDRWLCTISSCNVAPSSHPSSQAQHVCLKCPVNWHTSLGPHTNLQTILAQACLALPSTLSQFTPAHPQPPCPAPPPRRRPTSPSRPRCSRGGSYRTACRWTPTCTLRCWP